MYVLKAEVSGATTSGHQDIYVIIIISHQPYSYYNNPQAGDHDGPYEVGCSFVAGQLCCRIKDHHHPFCAIRDLEPQKVWQ